MDSSERYMKVPEVAELLRIPRSRAYELIGRGLIPGVVRIGRTIRIDRIAFEDQIGEGGADSQRQARNGFSVEGESR